MKENPCKPDCQLRTATCHATCKEYLEFHEDNAIQREEIHRKKKINGYIRDAVRASKKSSKAWKGKVQ